MGVNLARDLGQVAVKALMINMTHLGGLSSGLHLALF